MRRRSRSTWTSSALRVGTPCGHARTGERVAGDDCAEAVEERRGQRLFDRRQRDPVVAVVQQPVGVEVRRDAVVFGPPLDRPPASSAVRTRSRPRRPSPRDSREHRADRRSVTTRSRGTPRSRSSSNRAVVCRPVQDFDVHRCRRYESNVSLVLLRGDASGQVTGRGHDGRTEAATAVRTQNATAGPLTLIAATTRSVGRANRCADARDARLPLPDALGVARGAGPRRAPAARRRTGRGRRPTRGAPCRPSPW